MERWLCKCYFACVEHTGPIWVKLHKCILTAYSTQSVTSFQNFQNCLACMFEVVFLLHSLESYETVHLIVRTQTECEHIWNVHFSFLVYQVIWEVQFCVFTGFTQCRSVIFQYCAGIMPRPKCEVTQQSSLEENNDQDWFSDTQYLSEFEKSKQ